MLQKSIQSLLLAACFLASAAAIHAQTAEEEVRGLMKTMNIDAQYKHMQSLMTQQIKPALSHIVQSLPEEKRASFLETAEQLLEQLAAAEPTELIEQTIRVYAKAYSTEEIKGLQAFYSTPLGQKMLKATPEITNELMGASMQWNQSQANKLLEDLIQKFPELNSALAPKAPAGGGEHQHQ